MTELPKGWAVAKLDELNDPERPICYGILKPGPDLPGGVPYVKVKHIRHERIDVASLHRTSAEIDESYRRSRLRAGDLLISIRGTYGRVAPVPPELADANITQDSARIAPVGVRPTYVQKYLQGPQAQEFFRRVARGVAVKGVNIGDLRQTPIMVPPLAEQERIVTAIEEAFSKLDAGEAGLRTVRQLLKRMRDAILTAAVTGRLVPQDPTYIPAAKLLADLGVATAGGDGDIPDSWARVRLGDIANVGSGTTPRRGDASYWEDGTVPWVTSGSITNGIIREAREFVTERALRETSLRLWPAGTLLVAMYGEGQTRGRCAELGIEATCNQACAAISLLQPLRVYKHFVRLSFDANYSANRRLASGGVQPNLNAGLIKDMVLSLPPPEQQSRIVAEVDRQFSFIDACERAVDAGLVRSAGLRRSVLKSAFEGRLVAQDPSDEPASVLLDRVRRSRVDPRLRIARRNRRHTPSVESEA